MESYSRSSHDVIGSLIEFRALLEYFTGLLCQPEGLRKSPAVWLD